MNSIPTAWIIAAALVLLCASPASTAQAIVKTSPPSGIEFDLGIATYAFRDKSLEEVVRCAEQLRIGKLTLKSNHLALDASDEQIASVLEQTQSAGLDVYALGVIYMKDAQSVEQAFDLAQRAEVGMIVGVPAPELLNLVEQKAIDTGVQVAIHIHGNFKQLYPDAKSVYDQIKDRDARLGICLDIGHTTRINQDPAKIIRQYADRILDVQLWDSSSATPEGRAVLAGYGVVDFQAVMQALINIGYAGVVSIEYWDAPKSPAIGTAQTLAYLEGVTSTLEPTSPTPINTLTQEEKDAGWKLLFDGKTTEGWRGINRDKFPDIGWAIRDGNLCSEAKGGGESANGGDIITLEKYSDFELSWEWKMITVGGNSGIKYFVAEGQHSNPKYGLGIEYQVLDDANHPWMKQDKMVPGDFRTVGSAYELYAATNKKLMPLGTYNHSRIVSKDNHVEHWLNGIKVLEFTRGSQDFRERVANSKFKKFGRFGELEEGHILLQDHGGKVWFRNIKLRELN
ncbi:MAG: family 16 glycoside hydrolase [Planctomycetota bacterium]